MSAATNDKTSDTASTETTTGPQPKKVGSKLQDLAYDITYRELEDRQAEAWVRENWQKVVGMLAVVMLAIWTWEMVRSSQQKSLADTAEKFAQAQKLYEEVQKDGAKPEQLRALRDSLNAVADGSGTYPELASLYLAAVDLDEKKVTEARDRLKSFRADVLSKAAPGAVTQERLVQELAALLTARSYLAEGASSEEIKRGRGALVQILQNAEVVAAEAALALVRMSTSAAERAEAQSEVQALVKRKPELRQTLDRELQVFGVNLDA